MPDRDKLNWLEFRILDHLADSSHALPIAELRDTLVPGHHESIVNLIFEMATDGLVAIFETKTGDKMVQISASGRALLFSVLTKAQGCE